jgi:hypothetical protein
VTKKNRFITLAQLYSFSLENKAVLSQFERYKGRYDIQHNGIEHNNKEYVTLNIMAEHCYAYYHFC